MDRPPVPRRHDPPRPWLVLLLLALALARLADPSALSSLRAEDEPAAIAPSEAESELFQRVQFRLQRDLSQALQQENALGNPDHRLSQAKAQRNPAPFPGGSSWRGVGRIPVDGGVLTLPIPEGAEELPGSTAAVWYHDSLRIRVDSRLPDLVRPLDWREALPREFHTPPVGRQTVADRLADAVKTKFDELNGGDHFSIWLDIAQADAGELARPRLSFADRVLALYRLYKKALAPPDFRHYANDQLRCLVSLPVAEEQIHRHTGEKEKRWNSSALIAPPGGNALVRVTFSEPDGEKRILTENAVLGALANCRWESPKTQPLASAAVPAATPAGE